MNSKNSAPQKVERVVVVRADKRSDRRGLPREYSARRRRMRSEGRALNRRKTR